jgi:hypothetical protein
VDYSQRDFLRAVLPESGFVAVGRLAPQKGAFFEHDIYDNAEALIAALDNIDYTRQNYYFTVSSFAEKSVFERGKQRFRTQANAKLTRCIILDVDIKTQDGYYTTKEDAWDGIQRISMQLNLPNPIVVDSGFGYHVYWPMVAGVSSKEWQAVAKLFYQALSITEPRAVADASRVSDSASVLRIPETWNLKFNQQTPVAIVQWFDDVIDFGVFRETLQRVTGKRPDAPKVRLETNNAEFEKAELLPVIKNCNWTQDYLKNAETATEPAWYAMLGMAPFIEHTKDGLKLNGVDIAHMLSKKHPGYSHDATVIKFTQAKHGQTGPTTCSKFQQINSKPCETCPFRGAIKSPIQTARLQRPATEAQTVTTVVITDDGSKQTEDVVIPRPPSPYFRGESGGVYARVKEKIKNDNDEEEWVEKIVQIYDYDLYPVKRFRSELVEEEQIEVHLWLPRDGMRRFKMPTETLTEYKKLGAFLAGRGAIGEVGSAPRIAKYMVDYTRHLQQEASAEVEYSRFGWRDLQGPEPKFVVGNGFVDREGKVHPAAFPAYLKSAATSVAAFGTLDLWREGFEVYKNIPNSEAYVFTAMMGFAAPLMALTPYAGVLFNMVGKSGAGKSAALSVMTSVWGQPNPQRVNVNDTQIATYNTIGYLNSVPVAFDEITNMDPAIASQFALNFTGGRGKERAGRDGQNKENHITWDTIVVCTSNTSMYAKFTAARRGYNAEAMRLFEVNVPMGDAKYKPQIDRALAILESNYGHAGRTYIGAVMRNRQALSEAIEAKANQILSVTGGSNAERFWAVLLACAFIGGSVARKLGLHDYDLARMHEWATGQLNIARDTSGKAAADPKGMLGEFINANLESLVRIRDGQVDLKSEAIKNRNIRGRLEYDGEVLARAIISSKVLTDYCNLNNIDSSWLVTELKRLGVTNGVSKAQRLAAGTNLPSVTVRSLEFDLIQQIEEPDEQRANN